MAYTLSCEQCFFSVVVEEKIIFVCLFVCIFTSHCDSLEFSALSYAKMAQFTCNLVNTYISVHCLLLLQEKPPARVSFTSVFEEQWSVELLLWRQHVCSPSKIQLFLEKTSESATRLIRLIQSFVFKVRSCLKTLSYLAESCFDLADHYLRELPHF